MVHGDGAPCGVGRQPDKTKVVALRRTLVRLYTLIGGRLLEHTGNQTNSKSTNDLSLQCLSPLSRATIHLCTSSPLVLWSQHSLSPLHVRPAELKRHGGRHTNHIAVHQELCVHGRCLRAASAQAHRQRVHTRRPVRPTTRSHCAPDRRRYRLSLTDYARYAFRVPRATRHRRPACREALHRPIACTRPACHTRRCCHSNKRR